MDLPPKRTKAIAVKQWIKDYGAVGASTAIFVALLSLGISGLFNLGSMSAQLRIIDETIKKEIKPELKELRNLIEGQDGLRTQVIQASANVNSLESISLMTQRGVADINLRLQAVSSDIREISKEIQGVKNGLFEQSRQLVSLQQEIASLTGNPPPPKK
jgi:hypothetical protein